MIRDRIQIQTVVDEIIMLLAISQDTNNLGISPLGSGKIPKYSFSKPIYFHSHWLTSCLIELNLLVLTLARTLLAFYPDEYFIRFVHLTHLYPAIE